MRFRRDSAVALCLLIGLLAALPGIADVIESASPETDCLEPCPGDTAGGDCSSACDECACCPPAMPALFVPFAGLDTLGRIETAPPAVPSRSPFAVVKDVFHPPRA